MSGRRCLVYGSGRNFFIIGRADTFGYVLRPRKENKRKIK